MKQKTLLAVAGIALFIGMLFYFSMDLKRHRVEVCIAYAGRINCRTASGRTREQAQRTAIENACAGLTSGMTETIGCQATPPQSLKWLE